MDFDSKSGSQFSTAGNARRGRPGVGKGRRGQEQSGPKELKMMQDMQRYERSCRGRASQRLLLTIGQVYRLRTADDRGIVKRKKIRRRIP